MRPRTRNVTMVFDDRAVFAHYISSALHPGFWTVSERNENVQSAHKPYQSLWMIRGSQQTEELEECWLEGKIAFSGNGSVYEWTMEIVHTPVHWRLSIGMTVPRVFRT